MLKGNVLIVGVSYFEGMAGSMRVKNLIEPLLEKDMIDVNNLIFTKGSSTIATEGTSMGIPYRLIDLDEKRVGSIFKFLYKGCVFIKKSKQPNKKNILYNYDTPDLKSISLILFAKMSGYKIIYDIVEDHRFVTSYSGFMNKLRVTSTRYLLKATPFIADSVIAISAHLEERMKQICKKKIPVTLIPINVNFNFLNNEYKAPGEQIKIFYGGSFGEKDGLKYLLKGFELVAKNNKNIILVLTGKGEVSYDFKEIMKLIENSEYKERIHYKGYLNADEYYKVLNECDIFCMTRNNSLYANAGFPFKLGEFLASGKAVIATDVGDVSKYLKNGVNSILIKPESPEDISNAINRIVENPGLIKQFGLEARKTAEQHFNSSTLSLRLNNIFLEV